MARKRMAMELISNKRVRLNSLEKRKKSLKKSAHDLSTLCGVEIGMVIAYNQDSEVWPNLDTVHKLLPHDQDESSRRRTYGVLDYFKEKREKVEGEVKKMRERKYTKWDKEFESFSKGQLRELDSFLRAKIGAVREKINSRVFAEKIEKQETSFDVKEEQILAYNYNSYLEESEIMQQHQKMACCEAQSNNPYLKYTKFGMNPYLEESTEVYMPEIFIQQHQQQTAENNIGNQNQMVMNSHGASCNFHESQDNYGHLLKENWFENCGRQTEMVMMENFGINEFEPSMSYDEEMMMLQNWQGLISTTGFPEGHYHV